MNYFDKQRIALVWAYLVEILLSMCLAVLVFWFTNTQEVSEFLMKTNTGWLTLEGVLFAGAIGIWVTHFQILGTEFGKYLKWTGHENVFMNAFSVGIGSHFAAFVMLIFSGYYSNQILIYVTIFALIYALVNTWTLFNNIVSFLRCKSEFDSEYEAIKNDEKRRNAILKDGENLKFPLNEIIQNDLPKVNTAKQEKTKTKGKRKTKR